VPEIEGTSPGFIKRRLDRAAIPGAVALLRQVLRWFLRIVSVRTNCLATNGSRAAVTKGIPTLETLWGRHLMTSLWRTLTYQWR
jgi:hypothetical protein